MRRLLAQVEPASFTDEKVLTGEADGIGVLWRRGTRSEATVPPSASMRAGENIDDAIEDEMCNQLNALEWSKVGVGFSGVSSLMPLAHNKLAALQREGWRKVFESIEGAADGEPIMQHAAEYILSDRDGPRP